MIVYYRPVGTPHRYGCKKSNGEQAKRGLVFILTFSLHAFSVLVQCRKSVFFQCFFDSNRAIRQHRFKSKTHKVKLFLVCPEGFVNVIIVD